MTREALLTTPQPFTPPCAYCGHPTGAPVIVGVTERASGPPLVQYACPTCATRHGAGPSPDDDIN
ncbi:hypothetical protein ABZ714_18480 [Streptomyces sp. NPDC006798]|uniref:hypothetical protein n=1 Tax=Streptomyces sp. NPDC006798 TaxID=3155462 RepID=UPI0033C54EF2